VRHQRVAHFWRARMWLAFLHRFSLAFWKTYVCVLGRRGAAGAARVCGGGRGESGSAATRRLKGRGGGATCCELLLPIGFVTIFAVLYQQEKVKDYATQSFECDSASTTGRACGSGGAEGGGGRAEGMGGGARSQV
jgi:hypothetical protein